MLGCSASQKRVYPSRSACRARSSVLCSASAGVELSVTGARSRIDSRAIRTPLLNAIATLGFSRAGHPGDDGGMTTLGNLLENNAGWAASLLERDPAFFARLQQQQAPEYLWIGCSDSRVPANEIVGLAPGELFVHRNVANVVVHSDLNCLSVVQFAADVLHVRHVIVTGHYGCGGVLAALRDDKVGLADNWLRHVQDVHQKHAESLVSLQETQALDRL